MRIVIAEDSVLLREGRSRLLDDGGHEVVAAVGDGDAEKHVTSLFTKPGQPPDAADSRRVLAVLAWLGAP